MWTEDKPWLMLEEDFIWTRICCIYTKVAIIIRKTALTSVFLLQHFAIFERNVIYMYRSIYLSITSAENYLSKRDCSPNLTETFTMVCKLMKKG